MSSIAILASGRGSNAEAIINYFEGRTDVDIGLIVSNKKSAGVLSLARQNNIPSVVVDKLLWSSDPEQMASLLFGYQITHIVLAGFLWLIPSPLIRSFPARIINIHPALLPKYGGKGMYGHHIHEAVSQKGEQLTGISIHLVNDKYDEGEILFQESINIEPHLNPDLVAKSVLRLEHKYYPEIIDKWIGGGFN